MTHMLIYYVLQCPLSEAKYFTFIKNTWTELSHWSMQTLACANCQLYLNKFFQIFLLNVTIFLWLYRLYYLKITVKTTLRSSVLKAGSNISKHKGKERAISYSWFTFLYWKFRIIKKIYISFKLPLLFWHTVVQGHQPLVPC